MNFDLIREYCLSLPHATEDIQWGNDLLFRIAGKIFVGMNLDPPHSLMFKCTPERFDELIEYDGIVPAPYMARNKWVMLERLEALPGSQLKAQISISYDLVFSKLPKKLQLELASKPERGTRKKAALKNPRKK